jgi:hypothetical protein
MLEEAKKEQERQERNRQLIERMEQGQPPEPEAGGQNFIQRLRSRGESSFDSQMQKGYRAAAKKKKKKLSSRFV